MAEKTITSAKGFRAAGVSCGIKRSGKKDLALLSCPEGAVAAGVFTTNRIVSAAVTVCKANAAKAKCYGLVINSGNANACTGEKGLKDAGRMCEWTASGLGARPESVLVASTGIIGEMLPMEKVQAGIEAAAQRLADTEQAGIDFAQAIMTTDTRAKQAGKTVKIGGKNVTIGGTAKGAGMIGPNMATTICVLTTDAAIHKSLLKKALRHSIGESLNKLTVDGHQSTNDTALLLASGKAENTVIDRENADFDAFRQALQAVCEDLARQMALDAEGATRMFKVIVRNATTKREAAQAARAVADYDLVKCAIHGKDPNWGRIICAVGSCGVKLDAEKLSCTIGGIAVFRNGRPVKFDAQKVSGVIGQKEHTIEIGLGVGEAEDFCYGCDLSREYVTINADYHT